MAYFFPWSKRSFTKSSKGLGNSLVMASSVVSLSAGFSGFFAGFSSFFFGTGCLHG